MKPDWKDAPEWANWLAMDDDGEWWWFENKPSQFDDLQWYAPGNKSCAGYGVDWLGTLEGRKL